MKTALIRLYCLPRDTLILAVKAYRLLLSPWLGNACRFEPTCSAYSLQALKQHGAAAGSALTAYRLVRCQPWCSGGHDPVPASANAQAFFTRLLAADAARLSPFPPSSPLTPQSPSPRPEKNPP